MSAIYLHIPFCKRLCGYCDFFKSVKLQHLQPTVEVMEREIVEQHNFLQNRSIETIYFGGGTPSLLSITQIERFLNIIAQNYELENLSEITVEVNPDDITLDYLRGLHSAGVNRLSVGVQSFNDAQLQFMNRRHTAEQAVQAIKLAQSVGFNNITIDLIFGVDGFGEQILHHSISQALSLGVQHISAYHLTIESGTPFARKVEQKQMRVVSDSVSQAEYQLIERMFVEAGYEHYEVSNYALAGYRSKHNSSYWKEVEYLGIGPGAHSFNGVCRRFAANSIETYLNGTDERYQSEELSIIDHYNEFVMVSLRCTEGIDLQQMKSRFPSWLCDFLNNEINSWLLENKLKCENNRLYIPTEHFLISDAIIESLFYCE